MNKRSHLLRYVLVGIACLIILSVLAATRPLPVVQAASMAEPPILGPLNQGTGFRACIITDVYVDETLVMVICSVDSPVGSGRNRYAVEADAAHKLFADRALVLLNTAYALNVSIDLSYDENSTHNPSTCSILNCRRLRSLSLEH